MLTLYYATGACSLAPHIVLEELGLPYQTVRVNLAEAEQRKPPYLAINPLGRVPVLKVGDQTLTENPAILAYLAGGYPAGGMWPAETWDQAQVMRCMAYFSSTVHVAYANMIRPERFSKDLKTHAVVKASGRENFWKCLEAIDAMLLGKTWLVAGQYTVCDPYALVFYRWGKRQGYEVAKLKQYSQLVQRVLARPAVMRAFAAEGIKLNLT